MDWTPRRPTGDGGGLRRLPDLPAYPEGDDRPLPSTDGPKGPDGPDSPDGPDGPEPEGPPVITALSSIRGGAMTPKPDRHPYRRATAERPLRVGVIGVGIGAAVHVPVIVHMPETELIAICARRTGRAIAVAAQHEVPLVTADFRQVISDTDVEAVVVAAPPHLHHQMVIAALEAGKHVLCEAPIGRSLAEARDMARMAASAGVVAMVNHQFRFEPIRMRVKALLDSGYIGQPQAVNLTVFRSTLADPYSRPHSWHSQLEQGGGMLAAIGSHEIDSLRWWLGEVASVAGVATTMVDRRILADGSGMARVDADDNVAFMLQFHSGALGTVHITTTSGVESGEEILLSGSEGILIAQSGGTLLGARRGERQLNEIDLPRAGDDGLPGDHGALGPTHRLMRDWVGAIRDERSSPTPSFADGTRVQEVMDGVRRSGSQARWIDISGTRFKSAVSRHVSI